MAKQPSYLSRRPLRGAVMTLFVATLVACGGQVAQQSPPADKDGAASRQDVPQPVAEAGRLLEDEEAGKSEAIVVTGQRPQPEVAEQKRQRNSQTQHAYAASPPAAMLAGQASMDAFRHASEPLNRENYEPIEDNGIKIAATDPVSTFSIDVDTGAYSNMRRFLVSGTLPPSDAIRVEELINYFSYDYAPPETPSQPFSVISEVAPTPWNPDTLLMQIGVKGYEVPAADRPASNLVFLVDVSGSMNNADKLPLLKNAFKMLTRNLDGRDRVSMVVYAGASGVVLEPTSGDNEGEILAALSQLQAGGSTNGASGIRLAYDVARSVFIEDGVNRVILATDGDFNVGTVNFDALIDLVERERETGVSLTTLGFGSGNFNDKLMEQLADAGNGNYAYIDNINEARKVLVEEMGATLQTIAKDVKIQVEFNPEQIAEYRLIGYENRALKREDFNNDKVDAGEIGAGHTVTAIYELTPVGSSARLTEPLRYSSAPKRMADTTSEIAFVKLRYKAPGGDTSKLLEFPVARADAVKPADTSDNFRFAAAVAAFGQQLRGGRFTSDYSFDETLALAGAALGQDRHGYRREFMSLVSAAKALGPVDNVQISDSGAQRR